MSIETASPDQKKFRLPNEKRNLWIIGGIVTALILIGFLSWYFLTTNTKIKEGLPDSNKQATNSANNSATASANQETPRTYPVKVYFSRNPDSDDDPAKVFPVDRNSPDLGVARFGLEQLFKGPTEAEKAAGYFTEIKLEGVSNCGEDFTLNITSGISTLKLCRSLEIAGALAEARIEAQIRATLQQFESVEKVVLLNKEENCLFDASGQNLCKE